MNEKELQALLVVAGLSIAVLAVANHRKRRRIQGLRRTLKNTYSALEISEALFETAVEQHPEIKIPEKLLNDMQSLVIMANNDL